MRRKHDDYQTPQPLADAICERLRVVMPRPCLLLEPSAGDGNFVRAARSVWPASYIVAHDIRPECRARCLAAGASWLVDKDTPDDRGMIDLVVGNPPYSIAEEHTAESIDVVKPGGYVAFLLRASFLFDGEERADRFWWPRGVGSCLRYTMGIAPRPSFTGDGGTDGAAYALMVWQKGYRGFPQVLPHIRWQKRAARALRVAA